MAGQDRTGGKALVPAQPARSSPGLDAQQQLPRACASGSAQKKRKQIARPHRPADTQPGPNSLQSARSRLIAAGGWSTAGRWHVPTYLRCGQRRSPHSACCRGGAEGLRSCRGRTHSLSSLPAGCRVLVPRRPRAGILGCKYAHAALRLGGGGLRAAWRVGEGGGGLRLGSGERAGGERFA